MKFLKNIELLNKRFWKYLLRYLFRNSPHTGAIDPAKVRKILILRLDRLGDMIVSTPLFRALKKRLPHVEIGVFGRSANIGLLEYDEIFTWKFSLSANLLQTLRMVLRARREDFDVLFNLNLNPSLTACIVANLAAPRAVKVRALDDASTPSCYNKTLGIDRNLETPMVDHLLTFLEVFGLTGEGEDRKPFLPLGEDVRVKADRFLEKSGLESSGYILLNPFSGEKRRDLGEVQTRDVAERVHGLTGVPVVIMWAPGRGGEFHSMTSGLGTSRVIAGPSGFSILETAALIEKCLLIITPDTSISHIANALGRPMLILFSKIRPTFREWYPQQARWKALHTDGFVSELTAGSIADRTFELFREMGEER